MARSPSRCPPARRPAFPTRPVVEVGPACGRTPGPHPLRSLTSTPHLGDPMDVAGFWTRSWINDDRLAVRQLLAPDVEVEWNLDAPVDEEELVRIQHKI